MKQLTPDEKALQLAVNICTVIMKPEIYYEMLPGIKNNHRKRDAFISEYLAFRKAYIGDLMFDYYQNKDIRESEQMETLLRDSYLPALINDIQKKNNTTYAGHIAQYNDIRFSYETKDFITDSCRAIFRNAGLFQGKDFTEDEYDEFEQYFFIPDALSFKKITFDILNGVNVFGKPSGTIKRVLYFMRLYPLKFWSLMFCIISLLSLIFFVPYKTNIPAAYLKNHLSYESMNGSINYGTFSSKPNMDKRLKQYTDISYGRLGLQEVIVAVVCAGGFILTISKRQ